MNVYPAHKFLNGLKKDVKRPKTIRAPDGPQRQKWMKTLNRSTCAKFAQKMVPKLLTPEQKESRMNICVDIINNIDTDPGILNNIDTDPGLLDTISAICVLFELETREGWFKFKCPEDAMSGLFQQNTYEPFLNE
ncbi:hypothetical protein NQ318_009353 [Aromia moschata]|uniref:Uncharacterized protein n=1 Tax=Aromia moschata TaxID=1265417 RepID=A0AAV8X625_9CUCU|nr:hypothetical protein NQ318_009353 [Aromia moschata]